LTGKLLAVHPGNCSQSLIPVRHFDKGKASRFKGLVIGDDLNRVHLAKGIEFPLQFLLGGLKRQIPYKDVHDNPSFPQK
jgi:hypothetical protein